MEHDGVHLREREFLARDELLPVRLRDGESEGAGDRAVGIERRKEQLDRWTVCKCPVGERDIKADRLPRGPGADDHPRGGRVDALHLRG